MKSHRMVLMVYWGHMRVVILYRPRSEHSRTVETFVQDFKRRHETSRLEVLDIDSRDGGALASLYDIMQFPAILALADNGSLLHSWEGGTMPLMDDVLYYSR